MAHQDFKRLQFSEGGTTFIQTNGARLIREIDSRLNGANCFLSIDHDPITNLITEARFYMTAARLPSDLRQKIEFSRTQSAVDGILYITNVKKTYYESDGATVDSEIDVPITRNSTTDVIEACNSVFSTTESLKL